MSFPIKYFPKKLHFLFSTDTNALGVAPSYLTGFFFASWQCRLIMRCQVINRLPIILKLYNVNLDTIGVAWVISCYTSSRKSCLTEPSLAYCLSNTGPCTDGVWWCWNGEFQTVNFFKKINKKKDQQWQKSGEMKGSSLQ